MIGPLIARDVRRAIGGAAWLPVAFFLVVATLVPFAVYRRLIHTQPGDFPL